MLHVKTIYNKPRKMEKKKIKRYTQESIKELFFKALELSSNERFTTFIQLSKLQKVHRKTYLSQARRYTELKEIYFQIKKNLERNILIEIESGLLSIQKGKLMLWNHRK